MKLFSKYSKLCDHDTSTLWTVRELTEGRTTCRSNTAHCVSSRGKKRRYYMNTKGKLFIYI